MQQGWAAGWPRCSKGRLLHTQGGPRRRPALAQARQGRRILYSFVHKIQCGERAALPACHVSKSFAHSGTALHLDAFQMCWWSLGFRFQMLADLLSRGVSTKNMAFGHIPLSAASLLVFRSFRNYRASLRRFGYHLLMYELL